WSTRYRSVACHDGRSWCEFFWSVSPALAVLFRNDLFEFFSVVDQTPVVDEESVATPGRDRELSYYGRSGHLRHFHARKNQAAALHSASVSVARSFACTQARRGKRVTFLQKLRSCIGSGLSCNCSCRSAVRLAVFPGLSAF